MVASDFIAVVIVAACKDCTSPQLPSACCKEEVWGRLTGTAREVHGSIQVLNLILRTPWVCIKGSSRSALGP